MKNAFKEIGKVILLIALLISVTSFKGSTGIDSEKIEKKQNTIEGKAYWFISYMFGKKMYVSYVFNNDCNHCENEIKEAYKKYLVMNDYVTNPSTSSMLTYQDVTNNKLKERRDEQIYKRKQQGYTVINVNFSYTED